MGIKRTYGASAVAKAGQAAGQARAAEAAANRAEHKRAQMEARNAQREERQYRQAIRSQDLAIDLQIQERSKLWEIEKIEMRSRMDFERDERTRQKKLAEKDAKLNALESAYKNGQINENDYQNAVLQTQSGLPIYTQGKIEQRSGGESVSSPSQQISAIKALKHEDYQEPNWLQSLIPGGKEELSPETIAEKEILQNIVSGGYKTQPIISETIEPQDVDSFEATVAQLKQIDMAQAKAYYNKWAGKF